MKGDDGATRRVGIGGLGGSRQVASSTTVDSIVLHTLHSTCQTEFVGIFVHTHQLGEKIGVYRQKKWCLVRHSMKYGAGIFVYASKDMEHPAGDSLPF